MTLERLSCTGIFASYREETTSKVFYTPAILSMLLFVDLSKCSSSPPPHPGSLSIKSLLCLPTDRIQKNGEFFYFMSEAELEHLAQAKGWLAERVKACEESAGASSGRVCADTVLTVRKFCFIFLY